MKHPVEAPPLAQVRGTSRVYVPSTMEDEDMGVDYLEGSVELEINLLGKGTSTITVDKKTPMMDLLIQVATKEDLNPSEYLLQVLSNKTKDCMYYKPSTPIGALDASTVHVVTKSVGNEETLKKLLNHSLAPSFRVQVRLPRNQLSVVRVGQGTTVADVFHQICAEKCLDPNKYEIQQPENLGENLSPNSNLFDCRVTEIVIVSKSKSPYRSVSTSDILHLQELDRKRNLTTSKARSSAGESASSDSIGCNSPSRSLSPAEHIMSSTPVPPVRNRKKKAPNPPPDALPEKTKICDNSDRQLSGSTTSLNSVGVKKRRAPSVPRKLPSIPQMPIPEESGQDKPSPRPRSLQVEPKEDVIPRNIISPPDSSHRSNNLSYQERLKYKNNKNNVSQEINISPDEDETCRNLPSLEQSSRTSTKPPPQGFVKSGQIGNRSGQPKAESSDKNEVTNGSRKHKTEIKYLPKSGESQEITLSPEEENANPQSNAAVVVNSYPEVKGSLAKSGISQELTLSLENVHHSELQETSVKKSLEEEDNPILKHGIKIEQRSPDSPGGKSDDTLSPSRIIDEEFTKALGDTILHDEESSDIGSQPSRSCRTISPDSAVACSPSSSRRSKSPKELLSPPEMEVQEENIRFSSEEEEEDTITEARNKGFYNNQFKYTNRAEINLCRRPLPNGENAVVQALNESFASLDSSGSKKNKKDILTTKVERSYPTGFKDRLDDSGTELEDMIPEYRNATASHVAPSPPKNPAIKFSIDSYNSRSMKEVSYGLKLARSDSMTLPTQTVAMNSSASSGKYATLPSAKPPTLVAPIEEIIPALIPAEKRPMTRDASAWTDKNITLYNVVPNQPKVSQTGSLDKNGLHKISKHVVSVTNNAHISDKDVKHASSENEPVVKRPVIPSDVIEAILKPSPPKGSNMSSSSTIQEKEDKRSVVEDVSCSSSSVSTLSSSDTDCIARQPPTKYHYSGPPSIQMSTWGDRKISPRVDVVTAHQSPPIVKQEDEEQQRSDIGIQSPTLPQVKSVINRMESAHSRSVEEKINIVYKDRVETMKNPKNYVLEASRKPSATPQSQVPPESNTSSSSPMLNRKPQFYFGESVSLPPKPSIPARQTAIDKVKRNEIMSHPQKLPDRKDENIPVIPVPETEQIIRYIKKNTVNHHPPPPPKPKRLSVGASDEPISELSAVKINSPSSRPANNIPVAPRLTNFPANVQKSPVKVQPTTMSAREELMNAIKNQVGHKRLKKTPNPAHNL